MTNEELKYVKPLILTRVSKKNYNYIIEKFENINQKYYKFYSKKF